MLALPTGEGVDGLLCVDVSEEIIRHCAMVSRGLVDSQLSK